MSQQHKNSDSAGACQFQGYNSITLSNQPMGLSAGVGVPPLHELTRSCEPRPEVEASRACRRVQNQSVSSSRRDRLDWWRTTEKFGRPSSN